MISLEEAKKRLGNLDKAKKQIEMSYFSLLGQIDMLNSLIDEHEHPEKYQKKKEQEKSK